LHEFSRDPCTSLFIYHMMMWRIKVFQFFVIIANKLFEIKHTELDYFMIVSVAVGSVVLFVDVLVRLNLGV